MRIEVGLLGIQVPSDLTEALLGPKTVYYLEGVHFVVLSFLTLLGGFV